ncbi:hypothetical protein [Albibacterium bauzanense]|uniref:YD repeat-containing protein n=1 Tax=Albibacterium bauzanense TaxID=653929 RepID=A0A4R1LZR8_9SPHI|nr:hypothetical protein [Albibacterium bauzanense]TCK84835.1 hypothetical protein C8N28_0129 [Albibacterium bauzanense]
MKKVLLFLSVVLLSVSCSKNTVDPDPPIGPLSPPLPPATESNTLPVKVVLELEGKTKTYNFSYVSNTKKLEKITTSEERIESYEYEGDLITKIQYREGDYNTYEYENSILVREFEYRGSKQISKLEFGYLNNNAFTIKPYANKDGEWILDNSEGGDVSVEFDSNGNLLKGETELGDMGHLKINVTYDDKNSPIVNIPGWSKINILGGVPLGDNIDFVDIIGRRNNPSKVTITSEGGNMDFTYTYEFNDTDNPKFPTKISGKQNNVTLFSATITYKK